MFSLTKTLQERFSALTPDGTIQLFANIPLLSGQTGLRQMSFLPAGFLSGQTSPDLAVRRDRGHAARFDHRCAGAKKLRGQQHFGTFAGRNFDTIYGLVAGVAGACASGPHGISRYPAAFGSGFVGDKCAGLRIVVLALGRRRTSPTRSAGRSP